jgi:hypothetical protein
VIVISEGKDGKATGVAVGSIFVAQYSITLPYGLLEQGRHVGFGNGEILEGVAES